MSTTPYLGTLRGDFKVDSNGCATYNIPLETLPGVKKLEPKLALAYNSGGGDGMLGLGWHLQGLSAIARCPQTEAQDGVRGTINYSTSDCFAIDGQRLMVATPGGSYTATDAVYHTEIESWQKVVPAYSDTVPGRGGPDSFTVYTKDGSVLEYGVGDNSAVPVSSTNPSIRIWGLSNVTDANGNTLDITYQIDTLNNFAYPSEITYGGNTKTSVSPQRSVKFHFSPRTDSFPIYSGGYPFNVVQLLDQIQMYLDGNLVRTYTLAYEYGAATGRAHLISVTHADAVGTEVVNGFVTGGNPLTPTTFQWEAEPLDLFSATQSSLTPNQPQQGSFLPMDVDGNGRTDLVNAYENGVTLNLELTVFLSTGSSYDSGTVYATNVPYSGDMQILPMDVNGDGYADLVIAQSFGDYLQVYILLAQVNANGVFQGFEELSPQLFNGQGGLPSVPSGAQALALDVDGDGLTDLVCSYSNGDLLSLQILFSQGNSFISSPTDQTAQSIIQNQVQYLQGAIYLPMDFNGDTMTDIVYVYQDGSNYDFTLFLSEGRNGLMAQAQSPLAPGMTVSANGVLLAGDLNADGHGDLLQAYLDGSNLVLNTIVSDGISFRLAASQTFNVPQMGTGLPVISLTELNGDGLPDLLLSFQVGSQVTLSALLGTGAGFTLAGTAPSSNLPPDGTTLGTTNVGQPDSSIPAGATVLPVDVDGDGKTDLALAYGLGTNTGTNIVLGLMPATAGWPGVVSTITNGLNGQYQMKYAPLTNPDVYSRESAAPPQGQAAAGGLLNSAVTGATFALSNAPVQGSVTQGSTPTTQLMDFPKYVVSQYAKSDGRGGSYPYQCTYSSALMDLTGRGWLGFATMTVTEQYVDPATQAASTCNIATLTEYNQQFPLAGMEAETLVTRATDGAWMQSVTHDYQAAESPLGTGIQVVVPTVTTAGNFNFEPAPAPGGPAPTPETTAQTTLSNYDVFGNAQQLAETGTALGAPLYTFRTYSNDPNLWRIGFLSTETVAADSAGQTVLTKETRDYDASMNMLHRQLWNDQAAVMETTQYVYDPNYGNLTSITDCSGATTSIIIEPVYNTFVQSRQSPPNQKGVSLLWQYQYYPQFGIVKTTIDPSGVSWTRLVDGLGRESGTQGPGSDGSVVNLTGIQWGTDSTGTYMEETTLVDWNGGHSWKKRYLDGLLRHFMETSLGPDGSSTVVRANVLDAHNLPVQQSLPYYQGAQPLCLVKQYDAYQRATQQVQPQGSGTVTTQWEYTTLDNVKQTEALGQKDQRVTTTSYKLYKSKRLKVSQTDMTGATTTFTYDPLGRLTSAVDGGGVSTDVGYDSLNRKISFSVTGGAMSIGKSFQYNDTARTVVEKDANGTVITQVYDALGRRIGRTLQPASGAAVQIDFAYDGSTDLTPQSYGLGQLTGVTASNGPGYAYIYDNYGNQNITTVTLASTTYQFQKTYSPQRKLLTTTYPDGTVQTNSYTQSDQLSGASLAIRGTQEAQASYSGFNAFGQPGSAVYPNSCQVTFNYDATGRLNGQSMSGAANATLADTAYTYTDFNEIWTVTDTVNAANSESFSYDPVGRLSQASGPYGNQSYTYDGSGNLNDKDGIRYKNSGYQVTSGTAGSESAFSGKYDATGNLVTAVRNSAAASYVYDSDNQLTASGTTTLSYDYLGRRVSKAVAGGASYYYPAPNYEVVNLAGGGQQRTIYLYVGRDLVAFSTKSLAGTPVQTVYYNYQNRVKSSLLQTDTSGNVAAEIVYWPFGQIYSQTADILSRKFSGKEWDSDLGLYYFGGRYYDASSGRFLSLDDQTGAQFDQHDALNRYCYGINDPINQYDPTGHSIGNIFAAIGRFVLDAAMIVGGIAILATTPLTAVFGAGVGGALSTIAGSVLLGAGISGLTTDITTAVNHGSFTSANSWRNWGVSIGIGAAGGLISGGFAAGASALVTAAAAQVGLEGASALWASFGVGGAARILTNVAGGVVGNAIAGFTQEVLGNINPFNPSYTPGSAFAGVGFATLLGGLLGGAAAGASEGVAFLRSVRVKAPDLGDVEMGDVGERKPLLPQEKGDVEPPKGWRWVEDTVKNNTIMSLPGAAFTGVDAFFTAVNWHPAW